MVGKVITHTTRKRAVLAAYDGLSVLMVALVASCAFVTPAYAYIDPSVMTYTIQAVAGVAVALSAVLGVVLRRGRKLVYSLLDIDENANRTIEREVSRVDGHAQIETAAECTAAESAESGHDEGAERAAAEAVAAAVESTSECENTSELPSEKQASREQRVPSVSAEEAAGVVTLGEKKEAEKKTAKKKKSRFLDKNTFKPKWRQRIVAALLVSAFALFTPLIVAPLEVVGGSAGSLVFTLADVWWVPILPVTGGAVVLALVLSALRGRAFALALGVVFAFGLCFYVQALVLNYGMPIADGGTIVWADHMVMQVVSSAVWSAIIVGCILFTLHHAKRAQGIACIASAFLLVVQFIGVLSLFIAPPPPSEDTGGMDVLNADLLQKTEIVMTEDQLYTVSAKNNVIVFVLDTYDTAYLKRILRDFNADVLDGFDGFTNYENCTGTMIPTRFAIPQMLTGEMPVYGENFSTYKYERYARSSFLSDIYDANYSIGLYTDSLTIGHLPEAEQRSITDKTVNMHKMAVETMDYTGVLEALWYMGMYRDVLWPLKWHFWYYTDEINNMIVRYDPEASPEETIYVIDDVRYYNRLCNIQLSLEDDSYDGAFRFIHLLGAHYPFSYDEQVNYLGTDQSNVFRQAQGALYIVKEYCNQLKRLGVYENTTIIVTADHGYWTLTMDPIEETSTPIMFVKPAQSAALDALPMVTDEKPVSQGDLQATILDAMGLEYGEYATHEYQGFSMFDDIDPNRVRLYLTTDSEGLQEMRFREYVINGNALVWENWSETGRFWDALI